MVNQFGQWIPDYPGQQMYQDPSYIRLYGQANNMRVAQQNPQPTQQVQPQIHSGGLVTVHSETEARNWPIAPGNSVTFKDESAPYVYTKTMGYNQLDTPRFEKFRLVREEETPPPTTPEPEKPLDLSGYALKTDLESVRKEIEDLRKTVNSRRAMAKVSREEEGDVE